MLHRILDILNQKIMMGAGMHHRRRLTAGEGKVHRKKRRAGVVAGKKCRAGVVAGKKRRAGVTAGRKVSSPWIAHVKKYAKQHNIPYGLALSRAGGSYRR